MPTNQPKLVPQIKRIIAHRDARGLVFEPIESDELSSQKNCHVVMSLPGQVRGNHYHPCGTEILTVYGAAWVRIKTGDVVFDHFTQEDEVWRFHFEPQTAHAIKNIGNQAHWLVAFNTHPHSPDRPDVVREILIDPSSES